MVVMTIVLTMAGVSSYFKLGQLEDPNFTIKTALLLTYYPGATPLEVEQEVSDVLEEAVQAMGQIKEIESTSMEGLSYIEVDIKDSYKSYELPQIWDELRRKVRDCQGELPPGAGPTMVQDDFGDVYGVFFALTGKGYTYAELKDYADELKTELLLCPDVSRIDLWGVRQEVLYVEMNRAQMTTLGISPDQIYRTLEARNLVSPSGKTDVDGEYMRITPTGEFSSEQAIEELLIGSAQGVVRLKDVAHVYRGYREPPDNLMLYDGQNAIGFGISVIDGGNVVAMGQGVKERIEQLKPNRPLGMKLNTIYYQSDVVTESVNAFMINLAEAVVIVIVLLMLFMGLRSGLLIGGILVLTILSTFIGMSMMSIDLQKISLGALVLALGMLVDNAIVVADGILVRLGTGENRDQAAINVVKETQWPLFGATLVAILAFAAIGFADGNVGEFCRSMFYVMAISLLLSWILAVTVTPLFCVWFLKAPKQKSGKPFDKPFYRMYRKALHLSIRFRWIGVVLVLGLMFLAIQGFQFVPKGFFADSTQRIFYVNYWKPQGTHIDHTIKDLREIQAAVRKIDGVENVTAVAGQTALRFMLAYMVERPNSSYGQLLVQVKDYRDINKIIPQIEAYLAENYPDAEPYCTPIPTGPAVNMKVEARFRGPDRDELKKLGDQAMAIMRNEPLARDIRSDWRQKVRVIRPEFSESLARHSGVTRRDVTQALQWNFTGVQQGFFRDGDEMLPIISRPPEDERASLKDFGNVQVWSSLTSKFVPITQVVPKLDYVWEYPLIQRKDRQRIITAQCNPDGVMPEVLRQKLKAKIEAIELPVGYSMEWGGEIEESNTAQEGINASFPACLMGMFLIVVCLFNSVRKPLVIFLTLPLAIIGVTSALVITQLPFGFMAILGFLGLSGMLIKNAIVLIDQIELDIRQGKPKYQAVLDSGVSRLRPVVMAAGTTILGMIPLITDPLYAAMAATIMGGLFTATFLTLVFVPILYCIFYRIKPDNGMV